MAVALSFSFRGLGNQSRNDPELALRRFERGTLLATASQQFSQAETSAAHLE
jgi:hypothetical protein